MKKRVIYLASDHAGFRLKEKIKKYLQNKDIQYEDIGPKSYNEEDDYPDYVIPCAIKVSKDKDSKAIVIGGSGQGEAIAANKVKGIRAAVIYSFNKNAVQLSKEHNDANVLSLGARFLTEKEVMQTIGLWLKIQFSNEARHKRRIKKIIDYENKK